MKNLKSKIIILVVSLVVFASAGICLASYLSNKQGMENVVNSELTTLAVQGTEIVNMTMEKEWLSLETLAKNDTIANPAVSAVEKEKLVEGYAKDVGAVDVNYSDVSGNAMKSDGVTTIDISSKDFFQKAVKGERAVSEPSENLAEKGTIVLTYAVPIKWQGNIVGVLFKVCDGDSLSDITDKITFSKTGAAYMINKAGTTVANKDRSLVLKQDNIKNNLKDKPELQVMVDVQNKIMQGNTGSDQYTYNGVSKIIGYAPVKNADWFLAVTVEKSDVFSDLNKSLNNMIIYTIISIILGVLFAFLFSGKITKSIVIVTKKLDKIASGDFTEKIPEDVLKKKDETGRLANALKLMQESVREVISSVKNESEHVDEYAGIQEKSISKLLEELEDVSATTEELSASSEETAASTEELHASVEEIGESVEIIADRSKQGYEKAEEINIRAKELKKVASESKDTAMAIYENSEKTLKSAIDNAKEVNKINTLSQAILDISSETNLLALNASIEAARAGESGKGFAVVASQIGKLADDSQKSVEEIQKVTDYVLLSVDNLAKCSMQLLEFVDQRVLKDYDMLVNTSEQYDNDAGMINEIMSEFNQTTDKLQTTIHEMIQTIGEVSTVTNEGAEGTTHIAERSSVIVTNANQAVDYAKNTKESAKRLTATIEKFIV